MDKKTIRDIDVSSRRVLVRVDFNVPMDKQGNITDDARIRAAIPTITYLVERGAKVILMSHLGRPGGKVDVRLRMKPIAARVSQLLGRSVEALDDCVGTQVQARCLAMKRGEIVLLENVRFHAGDEDNDSGFSRQLGSLGEIFVNDAFGAAHRAHASTVGVASNLPAVAGLLMEKELEMLGVALETPERPYVAIVGGAKISDKIAVLTRLLSKVDKLLIGGGLANNFLKAQGYEVGKSLVQDEWLQEARNVVAAAGAKLLLPTDVVVADGLMADSPYGIVAINAIPANKMIVDIGPKSTELFSQALSGAKTVLWTGPLGVFELPPFAEGTKGVAAAVSRVHGKTIIGGGDTGAALEQLGYADKVTFISTGGGASLEFLGGQHLPGVEALQGR